MISCSVRLMNWFGNNDGWKVAAITRCDRFIQKGQKADRENLQIARRWGRVHLTLGLIATFFSTASTLLAFYERPFFVAVMTFLAALSTGSLTFLNPTKREIRRKTAASNFQNYVNRIEDLKFAVECSKISYSEVLAKFREINEELRELSKELLVSID